MGTWNLHWGLPLDEWHLLHKVLYIVFYTITIYKHTHTHTYARSRHRHTKLIFLHDFKFYNTDFPTEYIYHIAFVRIKNEELLYNIVIIQYVFRIFEYLLSHCNGFGAILAARFRCRSICSRNYYLYTS